MISSTESAETLPLRRIVAILLLGILGAIAAALLVNDATPVASLDLRWKRAEIMQRSENFLRSLGYNVRDLQQDAWFELDDRGHLYLQTRHDIATVNDIVRADTLPLHGWRVNWYDRSRSQSQNTERYFVQMSPGGKVVSFDHIIPDTAFLPSLSADEARVLAESLLSREHPDFASYRLTTSSDVKQIHRTDHLFQYVKYVEGMQLILSARVQGNDVGSMKWYYEPGGEFMSRFTSMATRMTLTSALSVAATFLLFFFVVTLFLMKYHEGEVGVRTAVMIFLGYFILAFLSTLNQFPGLGSGTGVGDLNRFYVRIVVFVFDVFIFSVFLSVLLFAAWSVGESSSRSVWPRKMTTVDSILFRRFWTADIGSSVLTGYGWGLLLLGLNAIALAVVAKNGTPILAGGLGDLPESLLPGIQPLLAGIVAALFGEIVTRLFFISFLAEKLRRRWGAVAISVIVWTATSYFSWPLPFGAPASYMQFLLLAGYGMAFAYLFLRYDLLTAIAAHVVVVAVSTAVPLLLSSGAAFTVDRWVFCALLAIPALAAVIGLARRQKFEFTPETMPRHIRRISERVRLMKELEIARNVQMSLLPHEQPTVQGFDIAGTCIPAEEVGGDYFDFVRLGADRLGIALGDVSGKGVPAAIYMTLTKGILQSHAEENVTPRTVLSKVNNLMYRTIERNSFVSMLYAVLDLRKKTLRFSRAGQCPVILAQHAGGDEMFLTPKGMALGLENGTVFNSVLEEQEVPLQSGEVLVFYTDGFTEAMNDRNEEFGEKRLAESVARHRDASAQQMINGICRDIKAFAGSSPQHDDMTMVVVKVLS